MRPHLWISTVFAQYVGRVLLSHYMDKVDDLRCDSLAHTVVRQRVVPLGESRMRNGGTCDNRLVIALHVCLSLYGYSRVSQGCPQIENLLCSYASCIKLRAVSSRFGGILSLGKPINRSAVKHMRMPVTALPVIIS
jgi:hypothetical protein